tara:strand:+ start:1600 stop:2820 length:1221 start_codon:yes stop_codon:yes gene_type:complete
MLIFIFYYIISPLIFIFIWLTKSLNPKIQSILSQDINLQTNLNNCNLSKKKRILIHAASAGEYEQIKPLIEKVDKKKFFVIISCMSPTIFDKIKENNLSDFTCYHGIDTPWHAKKFLNIIKPNIYITTRHDIWPIHLYIAKKMKVKTLIINANLYESSERLNWFWINFTKYIFKLFNSIIVPTKSIQKIFEDKLGINDTLVIPDTRFEQIIQRKSKSKLNHKLENLTNMKNIIFGSISDEDLKILNDETIKSLKDNNFNWIIVVPHEINLSLIKKIEKIFPHSIKYSNLKNIDKNFGCLIVDKVGILPELYKFTKIAYVGGGFGKGVHSTLEPLIYNNIVCYGTNIDLLSEAKEMSELSIGNIISNSSDLKNILKNSNNNIDVIKNYLDKKDNSSIKIYEHINEII